MNELKAPWTDEQVAILNRYQVLRICHPYTCGSLREPRCGRLRATRAGWVCPKCGYTQDWCHALSADEEFVADKERFNDPDEYMDYLRGKALRTSHEVLREIADRLENDEVVE